MTTIDDKYEETCDHVERIIKNVVDPKPWDANQQRTEMIAMVLLAEAHTGEGLYAAYIAIAALAMRLAAELAHKASQP